MLHVAAFLPAAIVEVMRAGLRGVSFSLVGVVVAAEILSWMTLGHLAAAGQLALTIALLSGMAVPYTMALSAVLLKRRFTMLAWVGALLVAAGVACCGLGPLVTITGAAQGALLVGALVVPAFALIGREALLTGSRPVGIAGGALMMSAVQLAASAALPGWPAPGAPSWTEALALLRSPGAGALWLHVMASGALRLSLAWALRASSAPTVQLLNAMAVPLGAAAIAGSTRNLAALLLSCAGAALHLGARFGRPAPRAEPAPAAEGPPEDAKKALKSAFMEELRAARTEERRRTERQRRQAARLERLKQRWSTVEAEQRKAEAGETGITMPQMFAEQEEDQGGGGLAAGGGGPSSTPLTEEELSRIETDEAYLGTMWRKWMQEHPDEWRRQESAARKAE